MLDANLIERESLRVCERALPTRVCVVESESGQQSDAATEFSSGLERVRVEHEHATFASTQLAEQQWTI